jgi:hypothetical protein
MKAKKIKYPIKWLATISALLLASMAFYHYTYLPDQVIMPQRLSNLAPEVPKKSPATKIQTTNALPEPHSEIELFDNSSAGKQLKAYLGMLDQLDPKLQSEENTADMLAHPDEYFDKLLEAYDKLDWVDFLSRYKIVYMMEHLKFPDAIPFLSGLAASPLPEESAPYQGDGSINEAHYEIMIRLRAVGGLYQLAQKGNTDARQSLLDVITHASELTIKNDAVWAYLATSKELTNDQEHLKTLLPQHEHNIITVKLDEPPVSKP